MEKNSFNFFKFLFGIVKVLAWIFVLLIVFIVAVQRFFNNEVSIGGYKMFTVASGSMVPVYEVYDVIISKDVALNTIKAGDDVVYLGNKGSFDGKIVTHRVIGVAKNGGEYTFQTKGIANKEADPLISGKQVYGVVAYHPIVLSFLSHILNNSYGLYFLIIVPMAFLIFLEILDRIKGRDEDDKEVKEES